MEPREDRWQSLVHGAFLLDEAVRAAGGGEARSQALVRLLNSVREVFPSGLDPVEEFEAYAVRRFALAARAALEPAEPAGP